MPVALAGSVGLLMAAYERRILAQLAATPDPDASRDFTFPAERTGTLATPDGGRLHVEECGSGRPVVLLHGHGGALGVFALLAARLAAEGRRVVAVDHRGFGRSSSVPPMFGFRGLVDDAATVLEALDLRRAIVVGHSMGGAVALGLSIHRPDVVADRVAALVLINSSARGPADRPLVRAQVTALDWPFLEGFSRHPRHGVVLARANFGAEPRRSHVEAARALGFDSPVERRRGFTRRLLGIDLTDALPVRRAARPAADRVGRPGGVAGRIRASRRADPGCPVRAVPRCRAHAAHGAQRGGGRADPAVRRRGRQPGSAETSRADRCSHDGGRRRPGLHDDAGRDRRAASSSWRPSPHDLA